MSGMRLLANGVLYVVVTLIMDLYRSGGSMSLDAHELFGRAAAGLVFAALFEAMVQLFPGMTGGRRK